MEGAKPVSIKCCRAVSPGYIQLRTDPIAEVVHEYMSCSGGGRGGMQGGKLTESDQLFLMASSAPVGAQMQKSNLAWKKDRKQRMWAASRSLSCSLVT